MTLISDKTGQFAKSKEQDMSSGVCYLTTIEDLFVLGQDIAIGPHCFVGRDEVFPEWKSLVFADPIPTEDAMEENEKMLRGLLNHLLPEITTRLNHYHGTSYSIEFWRIIVIPWLIELLQMTWTSFIRLRMVIDQNSSRLITVKISQDDFDWKFKGTLDFMHTYLEDYRFKWWIDSRIISILAPSHWRLIPSEPINHPKIKVPKDPPRSKVVSTFTRCVRNVKYCLGFTDISPLRWSGLFLALYVNLLPKSPSRVKFKVDPDFRPERFFPISFLGELNRLIDLTMPESFQGGFPALAAKAKRFPYFPGRLRLGTLSNWNDQEKVISAFATEAGEKRVDVQYGGEHGMLKYNMLYNELKANLCILVSWGWTYNDPDIGHVLPLPSPLHSKMANKHRRENDNIIFVITSFRLLLSRIHWTTQINTPIRICHETVNFLEKLQGHVRESVVLRPHFRTTNDIEIQDVVRVKFPTIPILDSDLDNALMKCCLVVLNSFGTAMNLSMAANVPTIIYLSPDLMKPREEAEPYFNPLRRCGVIHDSPEAAAEHLNYIHHNIEGWWNSGDVQDARKMWVRQFARTDSFWWWQWMIQLAGLRNSG